ncbi:MAG: hypothetical protein JOZ73_13655 [Solirubrobacterales bacterium]|nr:hypothetical protein [Solirubrobacterales bacterium]
MSASTWSSSRARLVAAIVLAALVVAGCGGGSAQQSPADAQAVVEKYMNAYNRGDDMAAAQVWSPAVGIPASYTPGYPVPPPTYKLRTTQEVARKLGLGCQRRQTSISASGTSDVRVVHLTYTSYGQRPQHPKCTAEGQTWREEITVVGGRIRQVVSTRLS